MKYLAKIVNVKNMYTFTVTYDRHKNLYPEKMGDFPQSYGRMESVMNWYNDPDWEIKIRP